MSARWPSSLLNATNRRLTERVEQLSYDLSNKRSAVADAREVVDLLKKHHLQAQQQVNAAAATLVNEQSGLEKEEGHFKELVHGIEGDVRRVCQLEDEEAQLRSTVAFLEISMEQQRLRLSNEQEAAVTLEEEAKELLLAHLARQRVGDELAAAQRELSSSIWAKLEGLHLRVRTSALHLDEARQEHRYVLSELDAARQNLQDAVKDQDESVLALGLVHTQTAQLDAHVLANASAMEVLQKAAEEKREQRAQMRAVLEHLLADDKRHATSQKHLQEQYNAQLQKLRETVEIIREREGQQASATYRHHAEELHVQQQRRELSHMAQLTEEKVSLLEQAKLRHAALMEANALLVKRADAGQPLPGALRDLILALSQQEGLLEDRLERTQVKLTSAIRTFVEEGRRGDDVNARLAAQQKNRVASFASHELTESEVQLLKHRCTHLEESLVERRALLPSMQALASEQRAQRQDAWMRDVAQLRVLLVGAQREHQQLRQGVTTLRSSLFQTRKELESGGASQSVQSEKLRLLEGEVAVLEREMAATAEEQRSAAAQHERATVTLQSLMKAADAQVSSLKEAAGAESFLRTEVQIEEEQLQASMRGRLLELHLHEQELHGLNEELQRHTKKLQLLRMRYEELIGSLNRSVQKPLNVMDSVAASGSLSLGVNESSTSFHSNPETLHAHLLLRRSYEREQLMQRGNYLDLRLVTLDRETSSLRHMLDGLRASSASQAIDAAPAAAPSRRSKSLSKENVQSHSCESSIAAPTYAVPDSSTFMKDQLRSAAAAKEQYWAMELRMLEEAMGAMGHERDRTRAQSTKLRSTLKELQGKERQKRMQLQKLRDALERTHKPASTAAAKLVK